MLETTGGSNIGRLWGAARTMIVGFAIGLLVFGGGYVLYSLIPDEDLRHTLVREDGFFEWLGASAFLLATILQLVLFWRSDVPVSRRLVPFMRRNIFYLGLAGVLFMAFAEEISWGQRIVGWQTPEFLSEVNQQGETNIHNLAPIAGNPLLNMTRLFNVFWLAYCVFVPITAVAATILARLYRRVSLPIPPYWIGGLFLGHFLAWRLYVALQGSRRDNEIEEAFLALCWVALGIAQIRRIDLGRRSEPDVEASPAAAPPA